MKTQTAEEYLKDKDTIDSLWTESDEDICKALNEFATTQIEALRERLLNKCKIEDIVKKGCGHVLLRSEIDQTINEFLKEIKP
jgi:hypothetical protein